MFSDEFDESNYIDGYTLDEPDYENRSEEKKENEKKEDDDKNSRKSKKKVIKKERPTAGTVNE